MADFCKECGYRFWGFDTRDLAGLTSEEETQHDIYASVVCEGCGPCFVDHNGEKMRAMEVSHDSATLSTQSSG